MKNSSSIMSTHYVHLIITVALIFGANLVPPLGPLSAYGTKIVILFCGIIYGYITMGMVIPSLMALVSLGFTGFGTVPDVLKAAIGNGTVLFVFAILMLSQMLTECNLSAKLINWLVTRKISKGKPWNLTILIVLAAYFGAFFLNVIPPCIILWGILYSLFKSVGYKPGDKWPAVVMFGVLYGVTIGAYVAPFQIAPIANFGILSSVSGGVYTIPFVGYFAWAFVVGTILLVLWFLFVRFVIKPDMSLLMKEDLFEEDKTPLTTEQKIIAVLFIVFIIGLFLPSVLPEGNVIRLLLENLGNAGWSLIILLVALVVYVKDQPLFKFDALFSKSVVWDITLMMACIFTVSGALADSSTGIPAIVSEAIGPMLSAMGAIPFWLLLMLVVIVLANLTNNIAVTCIFIPVMYSVGVNSSFDIMLFTAAVNLAAGIAFLSPACSPNAAMMNAEEPKMWITGKYSLVFSVFALVTVYLTTIVVGLPLGTVLL